MSFSERKRWPWFHFSWKFFIKYIITLFFFFFFFFSFSLFFYYYYSISIMTRERKRERERKNIRFIITGNYVAPIEASLTLDSNRCRRCTCMRPPIVSWDTIVISACANPSNSGWFAHLLWLLCVNLCRDDTLICRSCFRNNRGDVLETVRAYYTCMR